MARALPGGLMALLVWLFPLAALASEEPEVGPIEATHGAGAPVIPPTVWGILVFIAVLAILWWKAFPPIVEALEKRARLIQESLDAARRAKAEAETLMAKHEESLEKARIEARAIIEEGKSDAQKVRDHIVETARKDAEDLAARVLREIELAKQHAVDELHRQAARLAIDIASKVIHKSLKLEDHKALIEESLGKYREVQ
jgi:F-type H+-transporting ATPase subunit b